MSSHLRHHRIERELRLELLPRCLGDGRERRGWHGHFLKQREIDEMSEGTREKRVGSPCHLFPPVVIASKKVTLFPFIGAPPPLVQPYVASNRASCVLRKTRHIWATITSMGDRFAHPAPDSSNSTSISVSVDRDESGEHDANNAVCAGSTKRTHFHRRIVGPDSLTRRDIRRREQRATRQKPVSLRPSAHTLFLDDRGRISFAADRTIGSSREPNTKLIYRIEPFPPRKRF